MSKRLRDDEDTKMSNHSHESVWRRVIWELSEQSKTSLPSMLGMLLYKVPWLISLRFVGKLGSEELAAAALATTLCNVTGMSLSVGLSSRRTRDKHSGRAKPTYNEDQPNRAPPHYDIDSWNLHPACLGDSGRHLVDSRHQIYFIGTRSRRGPVIQNGALFTNSCSGSLGLLHQLDTYLVAASN